MVIPDIMNDVFLPQGRYHENMVLISQLEVVRKGRVKKGGTWRTLGVPNRRNGGGVIPAIMNHVFYPKEDTPKN